MTTFCRNILPRKFYPYAQNTILLSVRQVTTILSVWYVITLLSVSRWPHFFLFAKKPHFLSVWQMTTILSVCRWPHFYLCSDNQPFIFVQMAALYLCAHDHTFVWQVIDTKRDFQLSKNAIKIVKPLTWLPDYIPQCALLESSQGHVVTQSTREARIWSHHWKQNAVRPLCVP